MTVPAYVDIGRLCAELCICERTVDGWVKQGILPAPIMRGGKRLWKWTTVERYLDGEGENGASSEEFTRIRDHVQAARR